MANPQDDDFIADDDFIPDGEAQGLIDDDGMPVSPMVAAAGSAANAALLGYLPQVQAGIETMSTSSPEYIRRRDEIIKMLEEGSRQQPLASTAGTLTGAIGMPLGVGRAAGTTARTAGQLALRSGAAGAAMGAAQNPGDIEGELSGAQLSERLANAAKSGLLAAPMGYAAGAVGTPGGRRAIKDVAEERAFKALGPYARESRQAFSRGQVRPIGRAVLDEGVIGNVPRGPDVIGKRASAAAEKAGSAKGSVIDELNEFQEKLSQAFQKEAGGNMPAKVGQKIAKDATTSVGVSRAEIGKSLRERLLSDLPEQSGQNAKFEALISKFERENPYMTIKEADALKLKYKKLINWDRLPGADIPEQEQYYRAVYSALNQGVDDAADVLAKTYSEVVGKGMVDKLAKAKSRYGAMKTAEGITAKREARDFANRMVSPSDYGMGVGGAAIGAMSGDPKMAALGLSAGLANNLARKYGNQLTAKQMDNLQRLFSKVRAGTGTAGAIGSVSSLPSRNKRLKALEGK